MKIKNLHKKLLGLLSLGFALLVLNSSSCKKDQSETLTPSSRFDTIKTYSNPLGEISNIGDPYILQYDNKYYMYATSAGDGFYVWTSENLSDWEMKGYALNKNAEGNKWGSGDFWAPEVKCYKGKFYMTYSARTDKNLLKIRIAVSDSPLGPFINWSAPFYDSDEFSYIDANLMIDGDKVYMYHVKDCSVNVIDGKHTSQIYVAELDPRLKQFANTPKLITTPDQTWEGANNDWRWNEGPYAMKHDNLYYMFYSANVYSSSDYSIGYATASSPMGPWTKYAGNPVLKKDLSIGVSGPGHNCVTSSPDGKEMFIVYHTHTFPQNPSGNRNVCIDRMSFENGIIKINGPTRSPQPLPSGAAFKLVPKK